MKMTNQDMYKCFEAVAGNGVNVEDSQKAYEEWASTYEQDAEQYKFNNHLKVASVLTNIFCKSSRAKVRIIDVGAGTGLVGKELKKHGFVKIDALEPSEAMTNEAKKDEVYNHYCMEFLTASPTSLSADAYDVLTASGIYGSGHVPSEALYEMVRVVKPGGYVVIAANYNLLRQSKMYENLEPLMDRLEADGKWQKVSRDTWNADFGLNTNVQRIAWCYRVL